MAKTEILQKGAPILRKVARSVPVKEIKSKKTREILKKMREALHAEEDGAAIAAPQIGESLRIFMVRSDILAFIKDKNTRDRSKSRSAEVTKDLVFINPEILKNSQKKIKVEEGCLSVRWLYGQVKRSEKVTLKAYDEAGKEQTRGASGLLAQIFQHEVDHLNGVLFTDKAENIRDIPPPSRGQSTLPRGEGPQNMKFVFFGGSQFSRYVLEELKLMGFSPLFVISSARDPLPITQLKKSGAEIFIVASFGKILPKELIELPKYKTLNVHPSLLPQLRGPTPIQNFILNEPGLRRAEAGSGLAEAGVTIIRMDEKVDHGPVLAEAKVSITPWPNYYHVVEEKLGRAGGKMLGALLSKWIEGDPPDRTTSVVRAGIPETPQNDALASHTKLIKKEDGLLDLADPADKNLRKVLAYSTWPGAYFFYKNKAGKNIRVIVKDAEIKDGEFHPTRIIPAGKREMNWQDFLRGN